VTIDEVQPAGKPRMSAADWVRGRGAQVGQRFS
jgi:methionyl-tRNA formyltransferase